MTYSFCGYLYMMTLKYMNSPYVTIESLFLSLVEELELIHDHLEGIFNVHF